MLGPIATALGEVFQFQVKATKESGLSAMDLRTLLDWFIAYQLRGVDGVTEINAHGGELKTYQVEVDPDKLATYRLSMTELFGALRSNNANVGGGYLVRDGESRYIRGVSQVRNIDDIAAIVALLVSPRGRYTTGTAIAVDGGLLRSHCFVAI